MWALLLLAVLTWPLLDRLVESGAVGWDADHPLLARETAFGAGLVGAAMALGPLASGDRLLVQLPAGARIASEFVAVLTVALVVQLASFAGPLAAGHTHGLPTWELLSFDVHVAALATLALRVPLPAGIAATLFFAAVWLSPSLQRWHAPVGRALAGLLDPSPRLAGPLLPAQTWVSAWIELGPIAALLIIAALLTSPFPRSS